MPDHYSWLTFLLAHMRDTLSQNARNLGKTFIGEHDATWHNFEPLVASIGVGVFLILVALSVRSTLTKVDEAVVPDDKLTLRTGVEVFLDYFYNLAKDVMDAKRAKKYFPIIATSACFVFVANVMALLPGFPVPTSSLSITLGCAAVVFIAFNFYGLKENGLDYIKHLAGPAWYVAPLLFVIETFSLIVRPITLAFRLMLNMSVDHLLLSIFMGFLTVLVPLPVMILGCVVVLVQTLVFTLLTCVYIGLATEHEEHH
jgi:F-type H+-transporting ATPase subunit a